LSNFLINYTKDKKKRISWADQVLPTQSGGETQHAGGKSKRQSYDIREKELLKRGLG
jgi:hypothetical protein